MFRSFNVLEKSMKNMYKGFKKFVEKLLKNMFRKFKKDP